MGRRKLSRSVTASEHQQSRTAAACLKLLKPFADYLEPAVQEQICYDLSHHFDHTAACNEFFQTLQETVARLQKRSLSKSDPELVAEIHRTILEQYRLLMKHRPRSPRRS